MCQIDYQYLRPKKAEQLAAWHDAPFQRLDTLAVWQGCNATILPLRQVPGDQLVFGRGGVVDSGGNYVTLSQLDYRVEFAYPFENPQFRDEKVVYCGYLIQHWGHFLVEAVARLWYFLENDPTIDKYVFILEEGTHRSIQGNFREFLELLGIWDKLEFVTQPTAYREVVVPELALQVKHSYSPKFLDVFHRVVSNAPVDPSWQPLKKFYMTRTQLPKSHLYEFGFDSMDDFFRRNGYEILSPETLSLSQMIFYIRNAQEIASVSGTLPHNMLFAKPGQTIVILERCVVNNEFQVHVNQLLSLHTIYIDANIPIYTVSMAGPYIIGYNQWMQKFAQDNHMAPPGEEFLTQRFLKTCFVKYMKTYEDMYRYHWFMQDWYVPCLGYMAEAYQDSLAYFGDYLRGERPFLVRHYFQWHYFKQMVKILLKKVNLR